MTSEFRIDKPGVYCRRDGYRVYLWPTLSHGPMKWFAICSDPPASYQDNGSFWRGDYESSFDIVAYVSPLPADILQRMADALDAAEYQPQQTTPATFGEVLKAMAEEPKQ